MLNVLLKKAIVFAVESSDVPNKPCGLNSIISTNAKEYAIILYASNSRSASGNIVNTIAASIEPVMEPSPPKQAITNISTYFINPKLSGAI